ncbi:MAG: replication-associated recombination protein A [Candidatus Omnitrophica bacterium]|nr:replication-associated recombination protein A [Candidatus Omnitrophota bacterium]
MVKKNTPLAVRMRPCFLAEFVGQKHILGQGRLLQRAFISKKISSLIFWGAAGCGKTTMGFIVAKELDADIDHLNAAFSSVAVVRKAIEKAKIKLKQTGRRTILFIDEIHKFNKSQQEALVPDTEGGNIVLVGATIHNPFYSLIPSLISRSITAEFKPLTQEDIIFILKKALQDKERGLGKMQISITNKALEHIVVCSAGDARSALTALEIGACSTLPQEGKIIFDLEVAKESIQKNIFYDAGDQYHYDTASALIKSIRGSDVDSSLYWLAKMLKGGEDPRFIARRFTILASEDIGNANPFALVLATNCFKAVEFIGLPEAELILAQTVVYLATSPKSNASYAAIKAAKDDVENEQTQEVPAHIKTHAKNYKYPHSFGGHVVQDYGAKNRYYFPTESGEEAKIKRFLDDLHKKRP